MTTRNAHHRRWDDVSRRTLLRLSAGVGAGAALAIGDASAPVLAAQTAPGQALPSDAAEEQALRVATGNVQADAVFSFDPLHGGGDQEHWQSLLWMPPMYFGVDRQLQPGVFASWEANADFTSWTFRIDPRAKWSDNTPITAADVKGTWELMADPLTEQVRIVGYLGGVQGFGAVRDEGAADMSGLVAVDDRTLQVSLDGPDSIFHWRIATTHMNPVKIDQARPARTEFWQPENTPAGSGPYLLESFDPDLQEATMVRNPNWWLDEGPYLDSITFRNVPEQQIMATMVQNDEIDATLAPLPRALAEDFPDFFRPFDTIGFNLFWLNLDQEPTNDINVRRALIQSVNFADVFLAAYPEGLGATRPTQLLDQALGCYDTENEWYGYDPDAARAALAESSYGSAENLPRIRVTPHAESLPLRSALEAIMEFWRQNLGVTNVEYKAFAREWPEEDFPTINVSRNDIVIRFPDAATYMHVAAHSEGSYTQEGIIPMPFLGGYQNPEIDALLDEALALPADDPRRCELSIEAQRLFMEEYPVMLFADEQKFLNAREYVRNYAKGPDLALIEPWKIYLAAH